MQRVWICLVIAGLLALCGCPKPAAERVAEAEGAATTLAVEDGTAAGEVAAEDAAPEEAAEQKSEQASSPGSGAHRPSKSELQGKWFALYGGTGALAARTFTFEDGHLLEFLASGVAIWTVSGNGGNGLQLMSSWNMDSGEIALTVDQPGSLTAAPVEITPLAFGRDDEVGLTSGGAQDATPPAVFRFSPRLDGGFLALEGRRGELMVYGRVANSAPDSAPDINGKWKLRTPAGQSAQAEVEAKAGQIQVKWGSPLSSTFKGNYTNGYYVGSVTSRTGSAFAALTPAAGGVLEGVISAEPYNKMETSFDLTRE